MENVYFLIKHELRDVLNVAAIIYYVLNTLIHIIITATLRGRHYDTHFTDEKY